MAKKKAELEFETEQHRATMREVHSAQQGGQIQMAVDLAVFAFQYIDGMMQFERKYEDETARHSVESIDFVLRFAPLLFDTRSLDAVTTLLKSQRRIDNNATADLAAEVNKARILLGDAYRLWNHLEQNTEVRQDQLRSRLGGDQELWRWIAETWDGMGLVRRIPEQNSYRLSLVTRMNEITRGKCPLCGVTGKAAKARLLEEITCPKCGKGTRFVLMPANAGA